MRHFARLLRINNWIKNIFVLFPLVFSLKLLDIISLIHAVLALATFCVISSVIYILNDLKDIEKDKLHPRKKNRPIASGKVSNVSAFITIGLLLFIAIVLLFFLPSNVSFTLITYAILNLAYIYYLKKVFLLDSFIIALNFILRILVGCFAINVVPSNWILVVTFFIALLLTFIKRKSELLIMKEHATKHREVLKFYTVQTLDSYIYICSTATITAYILYTIDTGVIETFGTNKLLYSAIFVIVGIFRFLYLSNSNTYNSEGDPTSLLIKDRYLQVTFFLWALYIIILIYSKI